MHTPFADSSTDLCALGCASAGQFPCQGLPTGEGGGGERPKRDGCWTPVSPGRNSAPAAVRMCVGSHPIAVRVPPSPPPPQALRLSGAGETTTNTPFLKDMARAASCPKAHHAPCTIRTPTRSDFGQRSPVAHENSARLRAARRDAGGRRSPRARAMATRRSRAAGKPAPARAVQGRCKSVMPLLDQVLIALRCLTSERTSAGQPTDP